MASNRKPLVAGNWKMNGSSGLIDQFTQHFSSVDAVDCEYVLCPPALFVNKAIKGAESTKWQVAAQDVSHCEEGAHTGDLSAEMLAGIGCKYAIVGHSERRTDHAESDDVVVGKALRLISQNIIPIFCVGESLETRESGEEQSFVGGQLSALFAQLSEEQLAKVVIAYEPIWAIGTGVTASPEQAQSMHAFIRGLLKQQSEIVADSVRLLYGGSVKASNAAELFSQQDIDGGLVGGASLKPEEFEAICRATNV